MEQYISKDALVREIERQRNAYISEPGKYRVLSRILSLIDTLEVKDVENITDTLIENAASWIAQYKWNEKMIEDFKNYLKECQNTLTKIK